MGRASSTAGALAAVVAAMAATLWAMGRAPICTCGSVKLWHGAVQSAENSQHIADWYAPSHVVHGLLFYAALHYLLPRIALGWRAVTAAAVEAAWEVLENSPAVIDRYREVTIAFGYTGDSIVNSVSDVGMMLAGFFVASRLPAWASIALGVGLELIALAAIRDNLTLNVLMLIAPSEAIRTWQAG